jgi:hypothetical protein
MPEITIQRDYVDSSLARKVLEAVRPDNEGAPAGTTIEMRVAGTSLLVVVRSDADLPSFLRTVDDLLTCMQAAEGAAKSA